MCGARGVPTDLKLSRSVTDSQHDICRSSVQVQSNPNRETPNTMDPRVKLTRSDRRAPAPARGAAGPAKLGECACSKACENTDIFGIIEP